MRLIVSLLLVSSWVHARVLPEKFKIVGGAPVSATDRPWVIKIHYQGKGLCTGTLVHREWVITAAHCFADKTLTEDWSEFSLLGGGDGSFPQLVVLPAVETVHIHPDYKDYKTLGQDMALVHLKSPVTHSPTLASIPFGKFPAGEEAPVTISGWGYVDYYRALPNQLQTITLPAKRTVNLGPGPGPYFEDNPWDIDEGILVTQSPTATTCAGDSGAGWVRMIAGKPQLVGVHSSGDCISVALAAEIAPSMNWIRAHLFLGL